MYARILSPSGLIDYSEEPFPSQTIQARDAGLYSSWRETNMCALIVDAANMCWERGDSDKWWNYARIRQRHMKYEHKGHVC